MQKAYAQTELNFSRLGGVVRIVNTDLAVLDVTADGLAVREILSDISFEELQQLTGVPLLRAA